nr:MAG TPA: Protein of unknown function (DUF2577) [Caudoviricetes sp.]
MTKRKDDVYSDFVQLFDDPDRFEALPYCETGQVVSPLPDLKVQLRDLTYVKDKIKLNEYWMPDHEREIEIPSAPMTGSDGRGDGHVAGGFPKAKIIFRDTLKAGDLVACLQSKDKQTLYVIYRIGRW